MQKQFTFGILVALLLIATLNSCKNEQPNLNTDVKEGISPTNMNNDSIQFEVVKAYIKKEGEHNKVNASSIAGDTSKWVVDYYSVKREQWKITSDHSNRIYFSLDSTAYGNILLENGHTRVEANYLGNRKDIDTLNEISTPIREIYNTLFNQAVTE